jgi:type III secretion protein Q
VSLHPPAPPAARLCFRLEQEDGQHYRVHCSFGSDLQAYLLALLEGLPYRAARDWQWLPVALHFEIGCTQLAAAQLRELALGDLILLDDYSLARDQSLTIRLAGGVFYTGKLNGKSITVQSIAETIMNEVKDAVHDTAKIKAISISELPIHLAFDLGEKTIPLRELKAIQPGYIFELDKTPEKAVAIRVEGRRIGAGELVQIEERIGVRVLELYSQFDE